MLVACWMVRLQPCVMKRELYKKWPHLYDRIADSAYYVANLVCVRVQDWKTRGLLGLDVHGKQTNPSANNANNERHLAPLELILNSIRFLSFIGQFFCVLRN